MDPYSSSLCRSLVSYGVVKVILNKSIKYVRDEIKSTEFTPFPKDDLQKLERIMSSISADLPEAEQLAVSAGDRDLVLGLEEVAYDIEDLLDLAANHKMEVNAGVSYLYEEAGPPFASDLMFLLRILDVIAAKLKLCFSGSSVHKPDFTPTLFNKTRSVTETSNYLKRLVGLEEVIMGREGDVKRLISCILSPSTNPNAIAVTGPGGIGKTTLVKQVCKHSRVSSRFDMVSWASYEDSLSYHEGFQWIFCGLEESAKRKGHSFQDKRGAEDSLVNFMRGIKFLLVVDDIKHELVSEWENLYLKLLEVGAEGSTIIMIAWSSVDIGGFTKRFNLEGIPEAECWSLFKRWAAFDEAESSLEDIGRSIVKKCGGSPLAVKTLARLLRNNRDKHHWEHIHETKLWSQCNEAWVAWCICLKLLPVELIPCYATHSIAGQNNFLSSDKLVWFWMAQGLLQSRDTGRRLRNALESINFLPLYLRDDLNTLMGREFKKCVSGEHIGNVNDHLLSTRMHSMWTGDEPLPDTIPEVSLKLKPLNKARTFLFKRPRGPLNVTKPFLEGLISNWKYLRVLLLDYSELRELPESIGNLKLLRYLSLAANYRLDVLPESMCNLVNLQTLDLSGCYQLEGLPRNMHKLVSMRHLLLSGDLNSLPEIALKSWTSLHHLQVCDSQNPESLVLKGIQNLTALRTLQIHDCNSFSSLPRELNSLTGLEELSIHHCLNLDSTGWEGINHLRNLRSLEIEGIPKLLKLPERLLQSAANSLEHLVIRNCKTLTTLSESLQLCTCLVDIIISYCPSLFSLPKGFHALKNLQVLSILGCPILVQRVDCHLISHIPIIDIDYRVVQNRATSTAQEKTGALNLSPITELRPASATSSSNLSPITEFRSSSATSSSSEIIPVPVEHHHHFFPSDYGYHHFSPPSKGVVEHHHLAPVENSHPSPPYDMNIDAQPTKMDVTHQLDMDATGLENRGVSIEEDSFERQVLKVELENDVEGKRILCLFKEGFEFEKYLLIQLWMALGFLTDEQMEVTGSNYFEKLVSEGYILCSAAKSFYKVNTRKLNTELDMITDKQNYYVILDNGNRNEVPSTETLHVSVVCDEIDESIFTALGRFKRLKILLFLRNYGSRLQEVPRELFLCYESLVALHLSGAHIKELPSSAEKMINLRFLDLSWTFIELLPERMYRFQELQTLRLKGCSHLHRLPKEMKELTELRHLDLDVLGQLATFPEGIGALVNLRTLSAFPVGIEEGHKISELKCLDNLTGEFCIANLENVQSQEEAKGASLTSKRSIKKLELRWSDHQFQEPKNEDATIFENLCPCSDLEEIQILCYPGTSFPGWIASVSFHKLVRITLFRCVHVSVLPSLEKLPALVSLEFISLNSVANVNFKGELGNCAFPKLQKLIVDEMLNVESWAEDREGDYPYLVEVIIKDCPKLPELPSLGYLPSLKHLEVSGCTKLEFVSEEKLSTSLQQLIVEDCPLLEEKCSKDGGLDWHKIQHVPTIWVDQVAIKTNVEDIIDDDDVDDDDDDDDESYY